MEKTKHCGKHFEWMATADQSMPFVDHGMHAFNNINNNNNKGKESSQSQNALHSEHKSELVNMAQAISTDTNNSAFGAETNSCNVNDSTSNGLFVNECGSDEQSNR